MQAVKPSRKTQYEEDMLEITNGLRSFINQGPFSVSKPSADSYARQFEKQNLRKSSKENYAR